MLTHGAKNIRDQPTAQLQAEAEDCYKMIVKYNRWISRAASTEEAKSLVEEKFRYKAKVNEIELELMRRAAEEWKENQEID